MVVPLLPTVVNEAVAEAKKNKLNTVHPVQKEKLKQIEEAETVEDDDGDVKEKNGG